ncbi:DEKNAAC100083 [Brettanomyces naardenensis]|uniref:GPN-loop GTPase n=1 Tax=Brettanomyces naardenensis TaxID=13370 RepID=A0A448YES2_BRENA|nr:DEKNAAC100083 [Brettanomyces naardenensis]
MSEESKAVKNQQGSLKAENTADKPAASANPKTEEPVRKPATIVCIGMAGSGKTTFMQRLNSHLHAKKEPPYVINLDPAVMNVPFGCNIDIRDSINYKKVMETYNLGPNGAIVTSLNLFATKIDQVISLVEKRSSSFNHCIIDTPGQIECFVWSASGSIVTEAFASEFPTVIAYIIDTPRTASPTTFISNMLYACSILYKTRLPMILVFNKTDVKSADFAKEWMTDFESFQDALQRNVELSDENSEGSGYMASLVNSMSLVLEEFYSTLDAVSCSAYTGAGFDDFLKAVDSKVEEYNEIYLAERKKTIEERKEREKRKKEKNLENLMEDMGLEDKKGKNEETDIGRRERVDVLSDLSSSEDDEDEIEAQIKKDEANGYEHGLIDLDDVNQDEEDEETKVSAAKKAIEERYKRAMAKGENDSKFAEDVAKYIRQTQG